MIIIIIIFELKNYILFELAEEVRRNSRMYDMLFVALSHPLSPYIYSLDDRCKQLDEKERTQIKEQLDPGARYSYYCLLFSVILPLSVIPIKILDFKITLVIKLKYME